MKPTHAANDNLINQTRQVWKPRLGRDLSREDARQIAENVTTFFTILAEWSRAGMPIPANDNGTPLETRGSRIDTKVEQQAVGANQEGRGHD